MLCGNKRPSVGFRNIRVYSYLIQMALYGYKLDISKVDIDTLVGENSDILDLNVFFNCEEELNPSLRYFTIRMDGDNSYHLLYVGYYDFVNLDDVQDTYKDILETLCQTYKPLEKYTFGPL